MRVVETSLRDTKNFISENFLVPPDNSPIFRFILQLSTEMFDLLAIICDSGHDLVILLWLLRRGFTMMVLVGTLLEQTIVTSAWIVITIAFLSLQWHFPRIRCPQTHNLESKFSEFLRIWLSVEMLWDKDEIFKSTTDFTNSLLIFCDIFFPPRCYRHRPNDWKKYWEMKCI